MKTDISKLDIDYSMEEVGRFVNRYYILAHRDFQCNRCVFLFICLWFI